MEEKAKTSRKMCFNYNSKLIKQKKYRLTAVCAVVIHCRENMFNKFPITS